MEVGAPPGTINLLTNKQQKLYENAKICYICTEKFKDKLAKDKNIEKLWTIVIRGPVHSICSLKYSVTKEITKKLA